MKLLKIILIVVVTFMMALYAFIYVWFHNSIDRVLSSEQQGWLINEIQNTPQLPDKIYDTMGKYYPSFYITNSWDNKMMYLLGFDQPCQCNDLYLPFIHGNRKSKVKWVPFNQQDLIIKLFLEKKVTQKDCFTYSMNISSFGSNIYGIESASDYFFNKVLKELNEEEIIGLYLIQQAPSFYNPNYNKERYLEKVSEIINKN
ncbi:transglycosylase domain-containing protein [Flammeovirga sp. OC4]|uniref:transglycosylase domain-containing protein n=1 Tax=Flammeovirga sp. OC4 TaxID=1382345 RepID=UPI0005C570B8|nr:transglycosylase domain-containing protein [Flammeovirga sp. OC4]